MKNMMPSSCSYGYEQGEALHKCLWNRKKSIYDYMIFYELQSYLGTTVTATLKEDFFFFFNILRHQKGKLLYFCFVLPFFSIVLHFT